MTEALEAAKATNQKVIHQRQNQKSKNLESKIHNLKPSTSHAKRFLPAHYTLAAASKKQDVQFNAPVAPKQAAALSNKALFAITCKEYDCLDIFLSDCDVKENNEHQLILQLTAAYNTVFKPGTSQADKLALSALAKQLSSSQSILKSTPFPSRKLLWQVDSNCQRSTPSPLSAQNKTRAL